MDDVIHLIEHLLDTKYCIDRFESIIDQLKISRDDLLRLLRADRYKDYFQLLRPTRSSRNSASEKLALTLDVSVLATEWSKKLGDDWHRSLAVLLYTLRSRLQESIMSLSTPLSLQCSTDAWQMYESNMSVWSWGPGQCTQQDDHRNTWLVMASGSCPIGNSSSKCWSQSIGKWPIGRRVAMCHSLNHLVLGLYRLRQEGRMC